MLFLDLDGFKTVNDSLGHAAGDQLLREVADRLPDAVRTGDTVARLGGDEFAILVEQTTPTRSTSRSAWPSGSCSACATPIALDDQAVTVSASIGIAAGDAGRPPPTSLLRDADVAMYRAKTAGKARWVLYDPAMRAAAVERLQLESDLVRALDERPARAGLPAGRRLLQTERIVGFEALLRWDHPTLGRRRARSSSSRSPRRPA